MHLLISNDDGLDAPGIDALANGLESLGRVTVVAPDQDRSGASSSLTLTNPIRVHKDRSGRYRVAGTPTDCVHLALAGLLEDQPDLVVSGINSGANLGDDTIYSGTVAAAIEGRSLGLPAIAISLVITAPGRHNYETAARVAAALIERLQSDPLPADTILNVNVPDVPWEELSGFQVTRLGNRHPAEKCVRELDPRGRPLWWIGPAGPEQDAGPGTDFNAIREGAVSVTPIHIDLTRYQAIEQVAGWIKGLESGG